MNQKKYHKKFYQFLREWLNGSIAIDRLSFATIEEYRNGRFHPSSRKFIFKSGKVHKDCFYECLTNPYLAFQEKEDRTYNEGEYVLTNLSPIDPTYLNEEERKVGKIKRYRLQELYLEANHLPYDKEKTPIKQLQKLESK